MISMYMFKGENQILASGHGLNVTVRRVRGEDAVTIEVFKPFTKLRWEGKVNGMTMLEVMEKLDAALKRLERF